MKKPKTSRCRQYFGKFEDAKAFLREALPPPRPLRVTRSRIIDAGDCDYIRGRFYIRVDKRLCEDAAILILFHEWAHMLAWDKKPDHGTEWSRAYRKVYAAWLKEIDET